MKAGILFQKDGQAQQRIVTAAAGLAERLGIHPRLLENLRVQRGDPAIRAMQQREAVADLLEAMVERVDAAQGSATSVALEEVMEKIEQAGVGKVTLLKIREALSGGSN